MPSYLIAYLPETKPLQIVRVVSGYRDLCALFAGIDLRGSARAGLDELRAAAAGAGEPAATARDALGLLVRLAGRSS